jgi:hypothetical protein
VTQLNGVGRKFGLRLLRIALHEEFNYFVIKVKGYCAIDFADRMRVFGFQVRLPPLNRHFSVTCSG